MASVQSMFTADKQLVFYAFVWTKEDVYFGGQIRQNAEAKTEIGLPSRDHAPYSYKATLSTNQSARYIETL